LPAGSPRGRATATIPSRPRLATSPTGKRKTSRCCAGVPRCCSCACRARGLLSAIRMPATRKTHRPMAR
jgi:hypothetical protein